jgi:transcriptional regulator with XRE-family HTH domain
MSTSKATLATDFRQAPDQNEGMPIYLREWREYRGFSPAYLARKIGCHRSLVSKWETRQRPLDKLKWINAICDVLDIKQEQLSKMPPAARPKEVRISSETASNPIAAASDRAVTEGETMFNERVASIQIIGELPPELVSTALNMLKSLRDAAVGPAANPQKRGSTPE